MEQEQLLPMQKDQAMHHQQTKKRRRLSRHLCNQRHDHFRSPERPQLQQCQGARAPIGSAIADKSDYHWLPTYYVFNRAMVSHDFVVMWRLRLRGAFVKPNGSVQEHQQLPRVTASKLDGLLRRWTFKHLCEFLRFNMLQFLTIQRWSALSSFPNWGRTRNLFFGTPPLWRTTTTLVLFLEGKGGRATTIPASEGEKNKSETMKKYCT